MGEGIKSSVIGIMNALRQAVVGTPQTAAGTTTSATFANPTNQPTLTFTATKSCKYMIFIASNWSVSAAATAQAAINASAGSPSTVFAQNAALVAAAASISVDCYAYTIDTLTSGVSYTYQLQALTSAGTLTFNQNVPANGVAIVAIQLE